MKVKQFDNRFKWQSFQIFRDIEKTLFASILLWYETKIISIFYGIWEEELMFALQGIPYFPYVEGGCLGDYLLQIYEYNDNINNTVLLSDLI